MIIVLSKSSIQIVNRTMFFKYVYAKIFEYLEIFFNIIKWILIIIVLLFHIDETFLHIRQCWLNDA